MKLAMIGTRKQAWVLAYQMQGVPNIRALEPIALDPMLLEIT